ncbi:MAG: isocitrate lyase/phosphoenolpyruvate mutase family protein [Egibacteraceae bacterium]
MQLPFSRADEKRLRLRAGLRGAAAVVAVGAHDALTAKLIERHGFDAVWVSGLGVSTMAHALPDLNLISMTEALDAARRIDAATELPVVADCDNGFGGLSNVVRTVCEYERAGISGISIEDNAFPKRNSLYPGESPRELIPVGEQARRIRAGKRAQSGEAFVVIARIESLIAGHGLADACERADAYVEAGADAILIHSKDKTLGEIEGFLSGWSGTDRVPLVAVPTLYPTFTAEQLRAKGFNMVILANQAMRAAVQAMEKALRTMREHGNAASVDPSIASVDHIFDLVGTREAIEAEDHAAVLARRPSMASRARVNGRHPS